MKHLVSSMTKTTKDRESIKIHKYITTQETKKSAVQTMQNQKQEAATPQRKVIQCGRGRGGEDAGKGGRGDINLSAKSARVLGVLADLNLLHLLTQRGTITGTIFAHDSNL
jgi:hypothetical protein